MQLIDVSAARALQLSLTPNPAKVTPVNFTSTKVSLPSVVPGQPAPPLSATGNLSHSYASHIDLVADICRETGYSPSSLILLTRDGQDITRQTDSLLSTVDPVVYLFRRDHVSLTPEQVEGNGHPSHGDSGSETGGYPEDDPVDVFVTAKESIHEVDAKGCEVSDALRLQAALLSHLDHAEGLVSRVETLFARASGEYDIIQRLNEANEALAANLSHHTKTAIDAVAVTLQAAQIVIERNTSLLKFWDRDLQMLKSLPILPQFLENQVPGGRPLGAAPSNMGFPKTPGLGDSQDLLAFSSSARREAVSEHTQTNRLVLADTIPLDKIVAWAIKCRDEHERFRAMADQVESLSNEITSKTREEHAGVCSEQRAEIFALDEEYSKYYRVVETSLTLKGEIEKDYAFSHEVADPDTLSDLVKQHERTHIPSLMHNLKDLGGLLTLTKRCKWNARRYIAGRVGRVSAIQGQLAELVTTKYPQLKQTLSRQQRSFEQLRHVRNLPLLYIKSVSELWQRNLYVNTLKSKTDAFRSFAREIREAELERQEVDGINELNEHGRGLPKGLLRLLFAEEYPPSVDVAIENDVDFAGIATSDLDGLCDAVMETASQYRATTCAKPSGSAPASPLARQSHSPDFFHAVEALREKRRPLTECFPDTDTSPAFRTAGLPQDDRTPTPQTGSVPFTLKQPEHTAQTLAVAVHENDCEATRPSRSPYSEQIRDSSRPGSVRTSRRGSGISPPGVVTSPSSTSKSGLSKALESEELVQLRNKLDEVTSLMRYVARRVEGSNQQLSGLQRDLQKMGSSLREGRKSFPSIPRRRYHSATTAQGSSQRAANQHQQPFPTPAPILAGSTTATTKTTATTHLGRQIELSGRETLSKVRSTGVRRSPLLLSGSGPVFIPDLGTPSSYGSSPSRFGHSGRSDAAVEPEGRAPSAPVTGEGEVERENDELEAAKTSLVKSLDVLERLSAGLALMSIPESCKSEHVSMRGDAA